MSLQDVSNTLILDIGSASIKAGVATESLPAVVFPSVVGIPAKKTGILKKKTITSSDEANLPSHIVGHEALHNLHRCTVTYPVERGVVQNWAYFEHIIQHCLTDLQLDAESTGVVLTELPFSPKGNAERIAQTLFEAFNIPQLAVIPSGLCALYASGRTTGVVLDSGAGVTHITPVFDSFIASNAINRINFGGDDVTQHLKTILFERGLNFTSPVDLLQVKKIKEQLCFVSQDYENDVKPATDEGSFLEDFRLPDGQSVALGKERFRAAEILFNPSILQSELPPLGDFVAECVKRCGIDIRKALMGNIVLCGGNTMFEGFGKRLETDATRHFPGLFGSVKVIDSADRLFSVWAGASVVANLPTFSSNIITNEVYQEHGPSIVHGYQKPHEDTDAVDA